MKTKWQKVYKSQSGSSKGPQLMDCIPTGNTSKRWSINHSEGAFGKHITMSTENLTTFMVDFVFQGHDQLQKWILGDEPGLG